MHLDADELCAAPISVRAVPRWNVWSVRPSLEDEAYSRSFAVSTLQPAGTVSAREDT